MGNDSNTYMTNMIFNIGNFSTIRGPYMKKIFNVGNFSKAIVAKRVFKMGNYSTTYMATFHTNLLPSWSSKWAAT